MRITRYCIYNQTNECFLSLGTRLGCDPFALLKRRFFRDPTSIDEGYWIAPLRRMKTMGFLSFHDLLYLDDRQNVVGVIESIYLPRLAPRCAGADSLLVLPEHTVRASGSQVGNQLVICSPEEMENWLRAKLEIKPEDPEPALHGEATDEWGDVHSAKSPNDQRPSRRANARSVCAHYRNLGSVAANRIRDISESGLYLVTEERWPVGTRVTMTLELTEARHSGNASPILVHLKVTRSGVDGLGLEFVSPPQDVAELECESLLVN
jgi:hypothetical protein